MRSNSILILFLFLFYSQTYSQNYVLSFDGVTDYVDLGSSVATGVRSIEMWFKPIEDLNSSNISNPKTLIGRNHLLINTYEFNLSFRSDGKLWFNVNSQGPSSSGGIVKSDINNWSKNQWYYVVAVIDPVDGMSMYIDGVKQSMTIPSETSALGALPYITTLGTWGDEYVRNFGGRLDEVRLWSRALDSSEIAQKKCGLVNPAGATALVAYYKMNEGSGTSVIDSSSMSFTGAVSGATWVPDSACFGVIQPPPNTYGEFVMTFDGSNDYLNLGSSLGNQLRAIEMYFQPNNAINASNYVEPKALIARNNGATFNDHEFNLSFNSGGHLRFGIKDANGTLHDVNSDTTSWNANQWYHCAVVIDPVKGMKMYIDGKRQSDTNSYNAATGSISTITAVGTWGDEYVRNFSGNMDELRLWTRSLSETEIIGNMCGIPDPSVENQLVAYYKMNEGSGLFAIDSSFFSSNASVTGAGWKADSICIVPGPKPNGLEDFNAQIKLNIYPNPASAELFISFDGTDAQITEIGITDIRGAFIKQILFDAGEDPVIVVANLPNGQYFLVATTNKEQTYRGRFIVQH